MLLIQKLASQWPIHGGWKFPFPPEPSASASPAIWRACEAPSVMIFETAADLQYPDQPGEAYFNDRVIVSEASNSSGRHLVLADKHGRHRLLLRTSATRPDAGYFVAADGHLAMRLSAIARLHDPTGRESGAKRGSSLRPTEYQKHRLVLMLRILDRQADPEGPPPTLRKVAMDIVYPKSQFDRAIEWKSSSERRQTQRLINEARYLMRTGYRHLLMGRTGRSGF